MYNLTENIKEAGRELTSRPVKATTAELLLIQNEIRRTHRDKPQPIRYGLYLAEILQRVSVPLEKYDLIAGRSIHRELSDEEETIFSACQSDKEPKRRYLAHAKAIKSRRYGRLCLIADTRRTLGATLLSLGL